MVAFADNYISVVIGRIGYIYREFCGGPVYLYVVLGSSATGPLAARGIVGNEGDVC
jgi:hypothetical protein